MDDSIARNISEAVRLTAAVRASESGRSDAVFKDPFAEALAGESGSPAARIKISLEDSWPFVARDIPLRSIRDPTRRTRRRLIVNLAAGLDTRPYRMALPTSLRWVGSRPARHPRLQGVRPRRRQPVCEVERVRLDLTNQDARRGCSPSGQSAQHVAVLSEGLIVYLMSHEVAELARDLAAPPTFDYWLVDSPRARARSMRERLGLLEEAGAPFCLRRRTALHSLAIRVARARKPIADAHCRSTWAAAAVASDAGDASGTVRPDVGDRQWSAVVLLRAES